MFLESAGSLRKKKQKQQKTLLNAVVLYIVNLKFLKAV
jgi:hypothetical protein